MKKEIKDYLPYYLGCEVWYQDKLWDLVGVSKPYKTNDEMFVDVDLRPEGKGFRTISYVSSSFTDLSLIKLRLRPLSSMTEDEMLHIAYNYAYPHVKFSTKQSALYSMDGRYKGWFTGYTDEFLYLLSRHFDLFNLIESGLAIDKTTQQ